MYVCDLDFERIEVEGMLDDNDQKPPCISRD